MSNEETTKLPANHENQTVSNRETNPYLAAEADSGSGLGRLLKFNKGAWLVGENEIDGGTKYLALIQEIQRGWVRFENGNVTGRIIGKVADHFKPPPRSEMGDTDPTSWDRDSRGDPRDPWVQQWILPLVDLETNAILVFVSGSKGGIAAIGKLCGAFGRKRPQVKGLPIVAIGTGSYKHPEFGKIPIPELSIVG